MNTSKQGSFSARTSAFVGQDLRNCWWRGPFPGITQEMLEQRAKRIPIPGGTASLIALRSGGRTRGPPYKSLNSKLPSFRWSGAIFPPFSWVKEGAASVTDTGIAHQLQCFFNNEHMLPPCGRKASCLGRPHLLLLRS